MPHYNKLLLMGHLCRDPQLSYTPNQTSVVSCSIAVNRTWYDAQKQKQEEVCFVEFEAWAGVADNINKYLHKGDPVFLEGYLKFEQWTAQDGTKRSKHKMVVQSFQFLPRGEKQEAKPEPKPAPEGAPTGDDIPF